MMEDHFGLERAPFRLGTDASFYYEAEAHRRAMAHLRYGLRQAEGFVVITGEPGVGKTMVVEQLLLSVQDSDVLAGMLVPNGLTPETLPERVLAAFDRRPIEGADPTESLRDYLADERRRGAKASLIIDEAQHLSDALLEELRLLSDLTHDGEALLQVCLIGQTALRRVLFRDDMEQFRQRIVASYHLAPLSAEDTEAYIRHRMRAAGHEGPDVFTAEAIGAIHRITGGVPRRINTLCARLLEQAAAEGRDAVDADDAQGTADQTVEDGPEARPDRPEAGRAPTPPREAARPNLTRVETAREPGSEPDPDETDEEAEAERALALVTAPPPAPLPDDGDDDDDDRPEDQGETPAPRAWPRPRPHAARAEGGGAARGYPVTVGQINAAIQSIQEEPTIVRAAAAQGVVEVPRPAPAEAGPAPQAPPRRMASPQELMLRGTKPAQAPVQAPGPEPREAAPAPAAPRTGEGERALRDFLEEAEAGLAELREAMTRLRERVDGLDAERRARRERLGRQVEAARERLDDLRLER